LARVGPGPPNLAFLGCRALGGSRVGEARQMRQRRRPRGRQPRVPDRVLRPVAFALHLLDQLAWVVLLKLHNIACAKQGYNATCCNAVVGSEYGNTPRPVTLDFHDAEAVLLCRQHGAGALLCQCGGHPADTSIRDGKKPCDALIAKRIC
jgi:hypothetical protein